MKNKLLRTSAIAVLLLIAVPALAQTDGNQTNQQLLERILRLESELGALRVAVQQSTQQATTAVETADDAIETATIAQKAIKKVAKTAKSAEEWKNSNSIVHLAGYASAGYTNKQMSDGRFDQVQFSPIFHYQYKDIVLLESEIEFKLEEDGSTDVALEYLTADLILNDYATLLVGKFLSPIGQFRQNIHPSWINKLPSAPSGFGHDGAAPTAEVGMQLRGAVPTGNSDMRLNYAVYVGNGPELELETEDGETEIHGIVSEGFGRDIDGSMVFGGRVGFIPIPKLELGVSSAFGNTAIVGEADRDYRIFGADIAYQRGRFDLRGEYVSQKVGELASSVAPDLWKWESWYMQGAYRLPANFEGVVRYTDYSSPHASQEQEQWAIGLNYLVAPQVIAKIAYEFNEGSVPSTDANRFMLQFAYGF